MTTATRQDAQSLVKRLYDAFNDSGTLGLGGTDEKEVLAALETARNQGIMRDVEAIYNATYRDEPGLREELVDELSGDELKKALGLYEEGMTVPSKNASTVNAPPAAGSNGKTVKVIGTVAPRSRHQKWRDDVLAVLNELQGKIKQGHGPTFGSVKGRDSRKDTKNWINNATDPVRFDNAAFNPLTEPYVAVGALFANLEQWNLDCSTYAEVALWLIWRRHVGSAAKFNTRFNGIILRNQNSQGLPLQPSVHAPDDPEEEPGIMADFDRGWNTSPIGTKVSWKNPGETLEDTAWGFEYGIKRTGAGPSQDQRYDAFPLDFNLTEGEVMRGLAANAFNYPRFYLLPEEGLRQFLAEEAEGKPLRTAMAESVGAVPRDRVPPEVIQNVKTHVVGTSYPHKMAYFQALSRAGVGRGFLAVFEEFAATVEDPENGEKYARKHIRRHDYTRPILD